MAGSLKKYNPADITITWLGTPLNQGIAEGTFVTMARTNRNKTLNTGSDGRSTVVINPNRTGTMKLTMRKGSGTNDFLTERVVDDETPNGVLNVGALQVKDANGESIYFDAQAFLDGPPNDEFASDEGNVEWSFMCPDLDIEPRGNNDVPVISGVP